WIGRNRRFARDVERLVASVEAFIYAAASVILLRRLARC
ncbi:MAG: IS5/IS1182 family transposase, partial [Alphaproteobacteria bacterium]|nr:IS5/IS1182 family transposase [Alphaproteobacteria bacterium]MCX7377232.1 IS5/IS1182 family transposase [Alphaproteobacteria bacterium]MCX7378324.1 IS5/IS1182 family transposase [Alphaproteobacteria bacterium]